MYIFLALLFSVLWASAFMGVKIGLRSSPPLFLMGVRFLIAGTALLLYARLRGLRLPDSRREWGRLVLLGLLNNAAYLGLSGIAMRTLSGGMAAVLASTNPLMLALVAPLFLRERLSALKAAGFGIAFLSVVGIMASRVGIGDRPGAMLMVLVANAMLVAGTVLFKRWAPQFDLAVIAGVQLLAGAVVLLPSLLLEPVADVRYDLNFLGAVAFLAFAVSCGALVIWFYLLRSGAASRASAFLFLNPVLGLFLGAAVLSEPLRAMDLLGSVGVGVGIYMVQRSS